MALNVKLVSRSENETIEIGRRLGSILKPPDVVLLMGELGAGKTTFVKGIATGMKIQDIVKSPTFTIAREYGVSPRKLYHLDLYRIQVEDFVVIEDYFGSDGVVVVEWGNEILPYMTLSYVSINLSYLSVFTRMIDIDVCCKHNECELLRRVKVAFGR